MHALTTQRPRFIRLFVRVVAYLAAVNLYELRDGGFSESKGGLGLERARQLQQEPPYLRRSRDLSGCGVEALPTRMHACARYVPARRVASLAQRMLLVHSANSHR